MTLIGIATVADVPSTRLATRAVEMVACPVGTAASGKAKVVCHWPIPVCRNAMLCEPTFNFRAVTLVVVTTAARTGVPSATTVGDNVA